ncbi:hypothetical protein WJM97_20000 [Okeanomitos corallinicola TIOX110]|uniref:Restriction endonuclease type IV Mrr domain-containing protein n=1 Tax=Okeanomitos corallinicola TIOX110 TaxID=3133117 RepID=A0ABZ2UTA3_9CYAN
MGRCWQKIVTAICKYHCPDFKQPFKIEIEEGGKHSEPCDLIVGKYAIDTKYRIGSGEDATHKKLIRYSKYLSKQGYVPILLILRNDNLPAAITACKSANWQVLTGQESMDFIHQISGIDVKTFLENNAGQYKVI